MPSYQHIVSLLFITLFLSIIARFEAKVTRTAAEDTSWAVCRYQPRKKEGIMTVGFLKLIASVAFRVSRENIPSRTYLHVIQPYITLVLMMQLARIF